MQKIESTKWHQSMRGYFAGSLYNIMVENDKIWLVVADLGYGMFDKIREDFPKRFLNTGASEQSAVGICVGLALEGMIPFFYSITTFGLYRPFEVLRNYVNYEKIPVRVALSGRDQDYHIDGFSHDSSDATSLFGGWRAGEGDGILNNIETMWPNTKEEIPDLVDTMVKENRPWFISLRR